MPLSNTELNRIADNIVASTLTFYLQYRRARRANGTSNRVTAGGGLFASGVDVTSAGWSLPASAT